MTSGMTHLEFPTKQELTARRQKISILLRKAVKGNAKAKEKLLNEYGIRVYSSSEVEEYEKGKPGERVRRLSLGKRENNGKSRVIKNR